MRQEYKSTIKDASSTEIALVEFVRLKKNSTESVVFRLANLIAMYEETISQLGLNS